MRYFVRGNDAAWFYSPAGEVDAFRFVRTRFKTEAVSIGFLTDRDEVLAADGWGDSPRVMHVLPSRPDSWERVFLNAKRAVSLTNWRDDTDLARQLDIRRLERAIGVIYRPETELRSHYFDAHLSRQFDAVVWFEQTSPLQPLPGAPAEGAPDTFPFGV